MLSSRGKHTPGLHSLRPFTKGHKLNTKFYTPEDEFTILKLGRAYISG